MNSRGRQKIRGGGGGEETPSTPLPPICFCHAFRISNAMISSILQDIDNFILKQFFNSVHIFPLKQLTIARALLSD